MLKYLFSCFVLAMMMISISSCNTTKYLAENECIVDKSGIEFDKAIKGINEKDVKLELERFEAYHPNHRFSLIPQEYIYMRNNQPQDSSGFNKVMRSIGRAPEILNKDDLAKSVNDIQTYLAVNKGLYGSKVFTTVTENKKKCQVVYHIEADQRFKIGKVTYISEDTSLINFVKSNIGSTSVVEGDYIEGVNFTSEKSRIVDLLQQAGYAEFQPQYVDFKGDSATVDKSIDIYIELYRPAKDQIHKRYKNGEIKIYTDYYNKQDTFFLNAQTYNAKNYLRENSDWVVKPNYIDRLIYLKPDSLANKNDRLITYNKLVGLSAYKFVSLNTYVNPLDSTTVNYDIKLTPHNFKWVGDFGTDTYYSTSAQFTNLIGFSVNGRLVNRNFLKGSEQYTIGADVTTELGFQNTNVDRFVQVRTLGFGLSNELEYPRVLPYLGLGKLSKKIGLIKSSLYNEFLANATTTININLNTQSLLNYYRVNSIQTGYGYKFNYSNRNSITINTAEITLNDYSQGNLFPRLIERNPILQKSFVDNFFTGAIFNKLLYIDNNSFGNGKISHNGIFGLEVSGIEAFALNKAYNAISGNDVTWRLFNNSFELSKFIRAEYDNRFTINTGKTSKLAFRAVAGAIIPFGDSEVNPYIRQFNVGGPNSLRGWQPRQLVGGIVDNERNQLYVNQGDMKLELNAEYRFDLISVLEGALFVDAGNVWLLPNSGDASTKLTSEFYKQIAIAAGYGFRFDFEYFIIRFDLGYKVRNPFKNELTQRYHNTFSEVRKQGLGNLQVGINYPF